MATYHVLAGIRPVWRFQEPSEPNPWVVWNPGGISKRGRTALVNQISVLGYGEATWLEIEGRSEKDAYRALIVDRLPSEPEIIAVMKAVCKANDVPGVDYANGAADLPNARLVEAQSGETGRSAQCVQRLARARGYVRWLA